MPHCVVLDTCELPGPDPATDRLEPWAGTVVYEAHVRGLTMLDARHPRGAARHVRGPGAPGRSSTTCSSLGVTTIELLPVHALRDRAAPRRRTGLHELLGLQHALRSSPRRRPTRPQAARERGAAAVLDEVKRHGQPAARGRPRGPPRRRLQPHVRGRAPTARTCPGAASTTPCYYLHDGGAPAALADVTGCGNSLDFRRGRAWSSMTLDSLRYWADDVGVDGFRFDLAVTLGRDPAVLGPTTRFLVALQTDPSCHGQARRRALGRRPRRLAHRVSSPSPMAEWNDRFRNAARVVLARRRPAAARTAHGARPARPRHPAGRARPTCSATATRRWSAARARRVNYVTAHDGFTLADLVAYDHKHNAANGEHNRDGTRRQPLVEPRDRGATSAARRPTRPGASSRCAAGRIRNLLGTLLLSAGTPMITAGDEIGRTQHGNNNAYCQDNEISWVRLGR